MVRPIERRLVRVALALAAIGAGCSGDGDGPRAFELDVRAADNNNVLEGPDLPDEWAHVEVEIVEAPRKVTAGGDDFPLVLEMRNTLDHTVSMDPCPVWQAGMGVQRGFDRRRHAALRSDWIASTSRTDQASNDDAAD